MRKLLKAIFIIILIPLTAFIVLVVYATVTDYRPQEKEMVQAPENVIPVLTDSSSFDLLIWNIGYAGLDKKMDFFYDGGKQVRSTNVRVNDNLKAIGDFLAQQDSVEIIM